MLFALITGCAMAEPLIGSLCIPFYETVAFVSRISGSVCEAVGLRDSAVETGASFSCGKHRRFVEKVTGFVVGCLMMKTVVDPDHRLNTSHTVYLFFRHLKILSKVFTLCLFWVLMIISLLINPMEAWKLILHHGKSTIIISDLSD